MRTRTIGSIVGACCLTIAAVAAARPAVADSTSPLAGARPVYVTNSETANVSVFIADVQTGIPELDHPLAKSGVGARQMTFTPDGRNAYASNSDDVTISAFSVGPLGRLTRLPGAAGTVHTGGTTPVGISVRPDGHTLYVADVDDSTVTAYTIAADGSLTKLQIIDTTVANPRGLSATPDGRFLYAGHGDDNPETRPGSVGAITAYAIGKDGSLTSVGSPIRVGKFCGTNAITPDGHRLYLVCQDTDEIYGFSIGAGGGLTPLPRSPYTVSDFPEGIATSPDGRYVWVAGPGLGHEPEGPGAVSSFTIGSDGALTEVPGSPVKAGLFPVGITVQPNGKFVYVSGGDAYGQLNAFRVGSTGRLFPLAGSPFRTGGVGPAFNSASVRPDQGPTAAFTTTVDGRSAAFDAAASTDSDGTVTQYRWDFGDGTSRTTTVPQTTHTYASPGTFHATVAVTDNEGCSTTFIATGQAVLCNGTSAATTTHDIIVY